VINEGDFVLIEVEGKTLDGKIFDTTKGELSKQLHGKEGPILIVYGKAVLLPGLNRILKGMSENEEKRILLKPEEAFGKRKNDLIRVVPFSAFKSINRKIKKGEVVSFNTEEGQVTGVIKSVSNGRVLVDFNHPLADKEVEYWIKVVKIMRDEKEKIKSLMENFNIKTYEIDMKEKIIRIEPNENYELVKINVTYLLPRFKVEELKK